MNILLFYTSHRQIDEYRYSSHLFNRNFRMKKSCDVILHCNNPNIDVNTLHSNATYETNVKIIIGKNTGFKSGLHTALGECFDQFQKYDWVIHMHPDVFVIDENPVMDLLEKELTTENIFIVDYHPHLGHDIQKVYCTDWFAFKPRLTPNFFKSVFPDDHPESVIPESYLYKSLNDLSIAHKQICRRNAQLREIDSYGMIHCHDLRKIDELTRNN